MSGDLFDGAKIPGLSLLPGFALPEETALIETAMAVASTSSFRIMATPGGAKMSAAITNCGAAGWVSDRRGYRYEPRDPLTGQPWPDMPELFRGLATRAAAQAGFADFCPDVCLMNRYMPGGKMGLHQDRDERDFSAPIVSVSLGLPASFLWGGPKRTDKTQRLALQSGDVVVWGGAQRLFFHGIATIGQGSHPALGAVRLNLTFRRAL
ncbi:MAG TPA: DNA oxidative demethylase AlkB [Acidocella sp.]|nr:DNA oxidative demethylase AlkB [Acidocella sp.]